MTMPKFPEPDPNFTQEQALTMILSSIALEEAALSHIMNAEGEKIQHVLNQARCGGFPSHISNVLEVNKSVTNLLEMIQQNQTILKNKMERVLEHLPKPTCLPELPYPRPPIPDCAPPGGMVANFFIIPRAYRCNEPLLWFEKNICYDTPAYPRETPKIQLPAPGPLLLCFYAVTKGATGFPHVLEMVIACKGVKPIAIKIAPGKWPGHPGFFKQTVLEMPCSCSTCRASVLVRAPAGLRIKQGGLFITSFRSDALRAIDLE